MKRMASGLRNADARARGARRGGQSSDGERRRPSAVSFGPKSGKRAEFRRSADRAAVVAKSFRQGEGIGRDKRHSLRGEAAKRALVAAIARGRERRMVAPFVGRLSAEASVVPEGRFEFSGDRGGVARLSSRGRSAADHTAADDLPDQRQRDDDRRQSRAEPRKARIRSARRRPTARLSRRTPLSPSPTQSHRQVRLVNQRDRPRNRSRHRLIVPDTNFHRM